MGLWAGVADRRQADGQSAALAFIVVAILTMTAMFPGFAAAQSADPLAHLKSPASNHVRFVNSRSRKSEDVALHSPFYAEQAQLLVDRMQAGRDACNLGQWSSAKLDLIALVARAQRSRDDLRKQRAENQRDGIKNPTLDAVLPRSEHDFDALTRIASRAPRWDDRNCGDPELTKEASEALDKLRKLLDPKNHRMCTFEEDIDDIEQAKEELKELKKRSHDPRTELYKNLEAGEEAAEREIMKLGKERRKQAADERRGPVPPDTHGCVPGRSWTGLSLGIETLENFGRVRTTESLAATDAITFQSTDSGDPLGVGIVAGYNFPAWNNTVVIGPFVSVDWLNQTINHTFTGGTFFGTTTHWVATVGTKVGVVPRPDLLVYALGGASWLNEDLNINFGGPVTSQNTTIPGLTFGLGAAFQPKFLQSVGRPVALFAQYQHTWWQDAKLTTPAASPFFNYVFQREDDTFKAGLNIYIGAPAR